MLPDITLNMFLGWLLTSGIKIVVVFIASLLVIKFSKAAVVKFLRAFIQKSLNGLLEANRDKKVEEERVKTLEKVIVSIIKTIVWIVAVITILPEFGINIGPLLTGLGVAGLALGLGARSLIQDYLAGLFILIEDQYRVGEDVELANTKGKVRSFTLRRTVIEDEAGFLSFIPNNQIKKATNFSRK